MTHDELLDRLKGHEWNDIEFKQASSAVPGNAYETVSAFSNTEGGWLIFGVSDSAGNYDIVGVVAVDKVQNDFLTTLRSGQKLNHVIDVRESIIKDDGRTLLVFYIPEVHRRDKPVFLDGDLRRSFIRKGACDVRCSKDEIRRLLLDASDERYESQSLDIDLDTCFDGDALRWYRDQFNRRNPAQDSSISDIGFMRGWGLIADRNGVQHPTRAAILLFGSQPAVMQLLPRPVVDCQWINTDYGEELLDERWSDRIVLETNLVQCWRSLVDFYVRHAERAFNIDPTTLQRTDIPPDYIAFREAAINLLVHQSYADHTRKGLLQFFRDRAVFSNPGDAFVRSSDLLEPGDDREVRNPRIVNAFRRIGLSEGAGTGVPTVYKSWRKLGRVPPIIENNRSDKTFRLTLLKEELLSDTQLLFEASLGVHLREEEASVFAFACREEHINLMDVKAVTGLSSPGAIDLVSRLVTQALLVRVNASPESYYKLAAHLQHDKEAETPILHALSDRQWEIIMQTHIPRTIGVLRRLVGISASEKEDFDNDELLPLISGHIVKRTRPDQPTHRLQAYALTEAGHKLRNRRLRQELENQGSHGH